MKRLKIKQRLCLFTLIVGIALFYGCEGNFSMGNPYDRADFGFNELQQIVEVDANTKSFRIQGKWIEGVFLENMSNNSESYRYPRVYLDTNTTAIHGEHFINYVDPGFKTIGLFTPIDSDILSREREVKLLPENITSEIVICYRIQACDGYGLNNHNLIQRHKVILKPKANNN